MQARGKMRRVRSDEGQNALRLWLRLLTCTNLIEARVRTRLREEFASTLPRFDMLAQLDAAARENEESKFGLTMSELSRRLMVTNGNVTGLTERLVQEGLVTRTVSSKDRRSQKVRLTAAGKRALHAMVPGHQKWIEKMFAGMAPADLDRLNALMGKLKQSVKSVSVR